MSSLGARDSVPLTGADCFLRAFDDEVRRRHGASHLSQLVLRLGPGFELPRFEAELAAAAHRHPVFSAPIGRRFGFGPPVYRTRRAARTPPPRVWVHDRDAPSRESAAAAPAIPDVFFERLNDRFDARHGELLKVDVVCYAGGRKGVDLAFTWLHLLLDGSGSERFVRMLASGKSESADPLGLAEGVRLPAGLRERGGMATAWQAHMQRFAARPPHSLAGPPRRGPQRLRYDVTTLDPETTTRVAARAREHAGFLTPMLFYLAAAVRAHDAVFRARGVDPGSYVVPLPVNLRPKGGAGAIFRTHVSLLWFQVATERVGNLDGLIDDLKEQRRTAVKAGLVEGGVAAMDFARFVPCRVYARMARRPFAGELCSFFFAYTDAFLPGLDTFFGARIENGFHAPSVPPSPGSGLVFSLRGERLNVTHVMQRGVLDDAERALLREQLLRDLVGDA